MSQINRRSFFAFLASLFSPRPDCSSPIPGVPKPKFTFGDRVFVEWECDSHLDPLYGCIFWQSGEIIGLFWSYQRKEWCYQVFWNEFCDALMPHFTYEDDEWESELELQSKPMMP